MSACKRENELFLFKQFNIEINDEINKYHLHNPLIDKPILTNLQFSLQHLLLNTALTIII